jgi:hypothetical protein
MTVRLSALYAGRHLPPGRFLALIYISGWADPRAIVRLEVLCKLKYTMTSSKIEPATNWATACPSHWLVVLLFSCRFPSLHWCKYSPSEGRHLLLFWLLRLVLFWLHLNRVSYLRLALLVSCFLLQTLKMEAVHSLETSVNLYKTTRRHFLEDITLQVRKRTHWVGVPMRLLCSAQICSFALSVV